MKIETKQVELRILKAEEGFSIYAKDDTNFEDPSTQVYLGKEASPDDWIEVEDKIAEAKRAEAKTKEDE